MNDDEFLEFLNTAVPNNHNIFKYLMVTRNKLRQHKRIAIAVSGGSDSSCIPMWKVHETANCRKEIWRAALMLNSVLTKEAIASLGFATMCKLENRRIPNGTYGGVGGRLFN